MQPAGASERPAGTPAFSTDRPTQLDERSVPDIAAPASVTDPGALLDVATGRPTPARVAPTAAPLVAAQRVGERPAQAADEPRSTATPRAPLVPSLPPVVIDRIEIITPPARPPAADPLAPVAARRAGRSRRGGTG